MKTKLYSRDILLILAASFCYFSSPMLVTPLITGFAGSVGASAALMGVIGGLMNLCSLFCRPLVGNLADRLSKYKVSTAGAALMSLACLGYILSSHPAGIVFFRVVNGVGFACCSVCMSTWMSNLLPKEKVGSGMGVYGMMNALGMAVDPGIGVTVYQTFGYHTAFAIALVFSLATLLIVQFVGDKGEPEPEALPAGPKDGRPALQIADPKVLPIAAIIMLFAIPYCATQSFLVSYAEARHLAVSVSLFFPLYAVVLLVLRLSLKGLFDRLPFGIFLAGGYGIMGSVCQSTAILLAGKGKRGLANSTYYIGLDLGMTLGPVIGGFLYGRLDLAWFYPALVLTVPLGGSGLSPLYEEILNLKQRPPRVFGAAALLVEKPV